MIAKLESDGLRLPVFPLRGEKDIFTNDAEILLKYGYKNVVLGGKPALAENEYAKAIFSETERDIYVSWEIHELEEATEEDYLAALADLGVNINEEENT